MDTIDQGSMVRIMNGKYKGASDAIDTFTKRLFGFARHVQEHSGIVCIRSGNCASRTVVTRARRLAVVCSAR